MPPLIHRHVPVCLILGGILLTWQVASAALPEGARGWPVGLAATLCVGLPNGALLLYFRRRERLVREAAIAEVREMMADRVRNPLAVIGMCVSMSGDGGAAGMVVEDLNLSLHKITQAVEGLSPASLGSWQAHYREALHTGPRPLIPMA